MHGAAEVLPQRHDIKNLQTGWKRRPIPSLKGLGRKQPSQSLTYKYANDSPLCKGAMAQYAMIRTAVHLKHVRNAPSLNCKYTLQQ